MTISLSSHDDLMARILLLVPAIGALVFSGCVSYSPPCVRWLDDPIVYQPSRYPDGDWNPSDLVFEDAHFTAIDGVKLHGWFCPATSPRAVVLVAHGNGGNLSDRCGLMRILQRDLRVTSMIFDYRGYGRSEGLPTEKGVLLDARAAREWLAQRSAIDAREIVLLGESLGGGVAVDLAAEEGAAGLVLQSTFTSLPDVAQTHLPYTPVRYLMRNRLDSLSKIGRYHGPLLQAHGDADQLIPLEVAQRLHAAAPGPKSMVIIPGAGHNWLPAPEYVQALDRFFDLVASNRPSIATTSNAAPPSIDVHMK